MANKKGISTALKRNLKSGKEYSKLIPPVRCERTRLGEGDTFYTVDAMKAWVEQYAGQTAKLAPVLVGRDLEGTVNNIYTFLYSHIQYEADGALQQLRSPACTWMQRKEGVDCKSFSVFASAILANLGIKHFIRQIRQPYFYPEEFTHVYVVVPKNQNDIDNSATFVLDATKHENVESDYIEKVDLKMTKLQHIGLNAPQDERTKRIVENFERFNRFLLDKGVPLETVNAIRERISSFTSRGKDPDVSVVHDGLMIQGVTFPLQFNQHVPFLAVQQAFGGPKGLGFSAAFGRSGLGFSFGDAFANFTGTTSQTSGSTIASGSGDATGGIVEAGLDLAAGAIPFGNIIMSVLGNLNLSENIANVLKYGLSSWGASATPEEMKKRFAERCYPWLQEMLASITIDNIDQKLTEIDFRLRMNMHVFVKLRDYHSNAKSTRLANDWAQQECNRLLTETFNSISAQLKQSGVSVVREKITSASQLIRPKVESFWSEKFHEVAQFLDKGAFRYKVDKASLKSWNNQQMQPQTGGSTTGSTGSNYQQPTTGQTGNVNDTQQKSGSNTGLILGGIALAAAPFFFMKKGAIAGALKSKKK